MVTPERGGGDDFKWGRFLVMSDPFGNGLCVLPFNGRVYDEIG